MLREIDSGNVCSQESGYKNNWVKFLVYFVEQKRIVTRVFTISLINPHVVVIQQLKEY